LQDAVHRVADGAGHGAVDGAGRRLVLLRAGVGGDAAGRDRAAAQRPQEALVPVGALVVGLLGVGQGTGHALVGAVDVGIQRRALLGLQAVLLVPDVLGGRLQRDLRGVLVRVLDHFEAHRTHGCWVLLPHTESASWDRGGGRNRYAVGERAARVACRSQASGFARRLGPLPYAVSCPI